MGGHQVRSDLVGAQDAAAQQKLRREVARLEGKQRKLSQKLARLDAQTANARYYCSKLSVI